MTQTIYTITNFSDDSDQPNAFGEDAALVWLDAFKSRGQAQWHIRAQILEELNEEGQMEDYDFINYEMDDIMLTETAKVTWPDDGKVHTIYQCSLYDPNTSWVISEVTLH